MTTDTVVNALSLALAAARRDGITVRSIKDLLCDGCGVAVALRAGYCHACADGLNEHYDTKGRAAGEVDGFALDCAAAHGDPEAANYLAGLRS